MAAATTGGAASGFDGATESKEGELMPPAPPTPASETFSLGIENGLNYIQSQHIGECSYDSTQIILFFADGFRQVFGKFAEDILNQAYKQKDETGDTKFNLFKLFNLDKLFEDVVGTYFGVEASNPQAPYLKSFLARAIRRYIMIKLQDGGWLMDHVLQAFKIPSVQTTCLAPFKPPSGALRRGSFNASAGVTTAETLMEMTGRKIEMTNGEFTTRGATPEQFLEVMEVILNGLTLPEPTLKSRFTMTQTYNAANFDNLVAIKIGSSSQVGGHANTIIRYRNQFYYCDNNIGQAVLLHPQLTSDIELKEGSIVFRYATEDDASFHFYINGKEYARGVSTTDATSAVFTSTEFVYFYANEPVALDAIGPPISTPPPLAPVVVTEPPIASNKITGTSSTFSKYWAARKASAALTTTRAFSKTRRLERPAMIVAEDTRVAKRFSRTLRSGRGKN